MARFLAVMAPPAGCRILDIGGLPDMWEMIDLDAEITLLNLDKVVPPPAPGARRAYHVIEADICVRPDLAAGYDMIFSNSVLEHVGSGRRQQQFADAVVAAPAYWVQVPAPAFPVEAHCSVLAWWWRPAAWRRRRIFEWRRAGRYWTARQMAGTRPIDAAALGRLFPGCTILRERVFGLTKSYYAFRR